MIRVVFAFLFSAFVLMAQAETTSPVSLSGFSAFGYPGQSSPEAACAAAVSGMGSIYKFLPNLLPSTCGVSYSSNNSWFGSAPIISATYMACPDSSWSLSGSSCTRLDCASNEYRGSDNLCHKDCSAKARTATVNGYYSTSADDWTSSLDGCQIECSKIISFNATSSGGGSIVDATMTNCKYTGKSSQTGEPEAIPELAPNPNDPKRKSDCAAKGMGYFEGAAGKITCMPEADSPLGNRPTFKEKKVTLVGPGVGASGTVTPNSPGVTGKTETTSCVGGNCTTITKNDSMPDVERFGTSNFGCAAGEYLTDGRCTSSSAITESSNDFCTKNPLDAACLQEGGFCAKNPSSPLCKISVQSAKGGYGSRLADIETAKLNLLSQFSTVKSEMAAQFSSMGGGSGSLPCPPGVTIFGKSFQLCTSKYDEQLQMIGSALVFMAAVVSAFIVMKR